MSQQCQFVKANGLRCKVTVKNGDLCRHHIDSKCPICFESIKTSNMKLSCEHKFHDSCITQWFVSADNCPVCRIPQLKNHLIQFKNMVQDDMREKYKDAIESLESENQMLRFRIARPHHRINF